jgi:alpha-D-ribose 1-methylphosphonate 5-triphosphate diphosphatase
MHASVAALRSVRGSENIRCEHWLHLRCEVANPDVVAHYEQLADEPFVRLVSVMDHTPGQRQWVDLDKYRKYTQRMGVLSDAAYEDLVSYRSRMQRLHARKNRAAIVSHAKARGVTLASHDDTTLEHVAEAAAEQIGISEFPTTLDAARAAREHGMTTIMGAPNIVRRGSHSGNVAAVELARAGLLDGLSSDYVPASLLHGAFMLAHEAAYSLPNALATVSHNTARMAGFDDRGEIAIGMRADLVRVRLRDQEPTVVGTWRAGVKVA